MFTTTITLPIIASVLLTAVAALDPASQCQTPPVQCCTTLAPANNPTVAEVLQWAGITPKYPNEDAGLTCSATPGTIGPGGNATCPENFTAVCCGQISDTPSGIDVDCVPVDLQA